MVVSQNDVAKVQPTHYKSMTNALKKGFRCKM